MSNLYIFIFIHPPNVVPLMNEVLLVKIIVQSYFESKASSPITFITFSITLTTSSITFTNFCHNCHNLLLHHLLSPSLCHSPPSSPSLLSSPPTPSPSLPLQSPSPSLHSSCSYLSTAFLLSSPIFNVMMLLNKPE